MAELALAAPGPVLAVVVRKLASGLWKELGLARSVHTDIEKLKSMLSTIQDVLDDAESKSITSKPLQGWLRKLRDASLDAEDAVEEFEAEALRRRMERHDHMTGKVRDFFSSNNPIAFRYKMAGKIRELRERFDEIAKQNRDFNLMVKSDSDRSVDRETSSLMVESEIYGRVEDEKVVMNFLVDSDKDKNISILSIVGLGGVGKTTIAQLVYNNERIEELFELRMWVCVGEKFDVKMVMQKMIEQVKGEQGNFSSLETMSSFLQEKLRTKRFLLVLDDLWNDKELEWDKLKPLFIQAKLGSKITVTTRSETVASAASTIGTVLIHKLQGLHDDDCWTLFKQRAFRFQREEDNPELVEIGWEIMKKCGGLPLAAKALGSLMSLKRGKVRWLAVKNNEIWNLSEDEIGILPALKLSYDHLPSHLKRCFTYCAVFPKDYKFEIERLIQLWMAEGLIDTLDTSQNAEDIGKEYFNKLLWRSFFQDVKMDEYNNPITCKMHDLVHDLACSITKDEALVMEGGARIISPECRYLSVMPHAVSSITLETIYKAKKLRSLLLLLQLPDYVFANYHHIAVSDEIFFNITKNFTQIRALDLNWGAIRKLSHKISRLQHLRFLDLSHNKIATLPASVTRLYNLQTLNLHKCNNLQELPEGISNLDNLRHIDISECTQITALPTSITKLYNLQTLDLKFCNKLQELPEGISNLSNLRHIYLSGCDGLSFMPRHLGRLSNLETLSMFIVAQENGRTIAELQHLNSIHGGLEIKNLHNVKDANEAMQANLGAKTRLNYLILNWYKWSGVAQLEPSSTEVEVAAGVLEGLQPHHNLRKLAMYNYIGTRLPNWISSSLPNLVKLTLQSLRRCEHLPSLGRLPSLKDLTMAGMHAVKRIGDEFYGDGGDSSAFPSLEELYLSDMPNLEEWHTEPTTTGRNIASFPHLSKLEIASCPKLMMRPYIPCSVEDLEIRGSNEMLLSAGSLAGLSKLKKLATIRCGVLSSSSSGWWDGLQYLTALEQLRIIGFNELTCLPEGIMYLPSLNTLDIWENRNLRSLEEGGTNQQQQPTPFFPALRDLQIFCADALTALPEWVGGLTSLQNLSITECPNLAMLPDGLQYLTALQTLYIQNCPQLTMLSEGLRYLTALRTLNISKCPQLTMIPDGLQHLTALQSLSISDLPQLTMLPDGLQHLTELQSLSIHNLPRLTMLSDGLQHLTALQSLSMCNLPQLTMSLDGLQHLTALKRLSISRFPQLTMLPDGLQHLTALQRLRISKLPQLTMLSDGLQHFTALQSLSISKLPQLTMLPDGLQHLTALQSLSVSYLPQLTMLPDGLQYLTALQSLSISDCLQIAMLPDDLQYLTALQDLEIHQCPLLVRRCKRKTGEDWHKIAHIPHIYIYIWPEEDGEESNGPSTFATKFLGQFGRARCMSLI